MKFNYSVLLFISTIFAQSHENSEDNECYTKLECKINDITEKMGSDKKFMKCYKFISSNDAMYNCIYKIAGLRDEQIKLLLNPSPASEKCNSSLESRFKDCIGKCASDKSCKETCANNKTENFIQCLANQFNIKGFDAKKAAHCSKQCDQDTLSEIMDCDMKCREPIYKKLEASAKDSKSDSQIDSKSSTTKSESKDSKPTSSANSFSTKPSSGITGLSTRLLSAISVSALLSLVL
jgi:hypothetical protein